MSGDPSDQIPLVLLGKFHHAAMTICGLPQLFQPFVRLPRHGEIGKYHSTVVRNIRQDLHHFVSITFVEFENVHIIHLDKSILRHHRQIFHGISKALHIKGFRSQAMKVKGLCQRIQQQFLHLCQIVIHQEALFSVKKVEPPQLLLFQSLFQIGKGCRADFFFCHGFTS